MRYFSGIEDILMNLSSRNYVAPVFMGSLFIGIGVYSLGVLMAEGLGVSEYMMIVSLVLVSIGILFPIAYIAQNIFELRQEIQGLKCKYEPAPTLPSEEKNGHTQSKNTPRSRSGGFREYG